MPQCYDHVLVTLPLVSAGVNCTWVVLGTGALESKHKALAMITDSTRSSNMLSSLFQGPKSTPEQAMGHNDAPNCISSHLQIPQFRALSFTASAWSSMSFQG
jgi:hypothetical protein